MKYLIYILIVLSPLTGYSQFIDKELYIYSRVGIGVGLTNFDYSSVLEGKALSVPKKIKVNMGGGLTTEIGIGLKMLEYFYLEPFVSYMYSRSKYKVDNGTEEYISSFSSNRFNIGINGKYFVYISPEMNFELHAGTSYRIPQDIIVETNFGEERIIYSSAVGVHCGFGGNYIHNDFVFNGGLRYRYEKYVLRNNQNNLPMNFANINPHLESLKVGGIDIIFSVMYNF